MRDMGKWKNEMMEKHGFFIHFVLDDQVGAGANYHTHGLEQSFGHPDLQCTLPITPEIIQSVFHTIVDRIKAGERFVAEQLYEKVITNYPVEFKEANEFGRKVLRLLLPDEKGLFPNDPMCNPVYKEQAKGVL
ncbi:DUF4262 domain-containing protein [Paenibacillus abyssi]|uniref:Uncharacterized protein n=1 Tax=Paenibacillus abyssi TaxID=1340531 RepID=A0A917G1I9_9BACL|nr:DUF4262 domain-containing protein [Paenibacillus abyssi]GGG18207.1 hypothetical protein GCM10010916_38780 [Paenibacillus abyssi]